ncbi:DUF3023 domain-containing protein [Ehrlichia ruminantium]|uniref:DUF3023 domain-containing protein n=1 Tax=Ehrlichia ruminantium TaxID=779 RepID=UPI0009949F3B|nr:DUF3023 domain-containing protein [Ehrlichia ruminantium]
MLFKYNPQNTKELHNAALNCLRHTRLYAYSYCCIGHTEPNGTLHVFISKDKSNNLCLPKEGYSLFYIECSLSDKRVSQNKEIRDLMQAVVRHKINRLAFNNYHTTPTIDLGIYILVNKSNLNMLTKEYITPTNNIDSVGHIILCKPVRAANGLFSLDFLFDEKEALKELGGLQNAVFTIIETTPPITKKSLFRKHSRGYSQLSEEYGKHKTTTKNTITESIEREEAQSNKQAEAGVDPHQLSHTEAITYGISLLTEISLAFEKLCTKYH